MDEARTGCCVFPSCSLTFLSPPTGGDPPPVPSIGDGRVHTLRSPVREVEAEEDSASTGDTMSREPDAALDSRETLRSDELMMYLQTVWRRKSVTAGTEVHVTSRK
ncbi:unnamed protein product [Pleuronectes platessa]|uniref:Uncharacterized protein n=1 Tax=Pleuronectes platessa TaxID=8262 RepID=A0A9N7Y652_PLEPL|nr:unnamed protein product [Pleuronectes platessa]